MNKIIIFTCVHFFCAGVSVGVGICLDAKRGERQAVLNFIFAALNLAGGVQYTIRLAEMLSAVAEAIK